MFRPHARLVSSLLHGSAASPGSRVPSVRPSVCDVLFIYFPFISLPISSLFVFLYLLVSHYLYPPLFSPLPIHNLDALNPSPGCPSHCSRGLTNPESSHAHTYTYYTFLVLLLLLPIPLRFPLRSRSRPRSRFLPPYTNTTYIPITTQHSLFLDSVLILIAHT
ncbi:hypothetical protein B0H12DRAFT_469883 [Mycena haematopus]|nr:hypothetical protein B0H12DRAFT_469883 [Mycena haematopus]